MLHTRVGGEDTGICGFSFLPRGPTLSFLVLKELILFISLPSLVPEELKLQPLNNVLLRSQGAVQTLHGSEAGYWVKLRQEA